MPGLVAASTMISGVAYAAPAGERTRYAGQVVALNDASFTLKTRDGSELAVLVDGDTKFFGNCSGIHARRAVPGAGRHPRSPRRPRRGE